MSDATRETIRDELDDELTISKIVDHAGSWQVNVQYNGTEPRFRQLVADPYMIENTLQTMDDDTIHTVLTRRNPSDR